jgi:prolyl oligopeptidase
MRNTLRRGLLLSLTGLLLGPACDKGGETTPPPDDGGQTEATAPEATARFTYPNTKRVDHVDDYHGTEVADPYRWLEDLDSEETAAWVAAENEVTFGYLESIEERDRIRKELTRLWNYERYGIPFKRGKRYFLTKNDGLQNQSVYYWMDDLEGEMKVLLDPNTLSKDGTVAVSGVAITDDGKYMAYALSSAGSDWKTWHVREVETGKDLDDVLEWAKFTGASWTKDGKGFFYGRYDAPKKGDEYEQLNYFQKLYYHRLGTPQSEDELVYERKDHKDWQFSGEVTDDGRYLIIDVSVGTDRRNMIFYKDLKKKKAEVVELISELESSYSFIDNKGSKLWFRTDNEAPRGRVIAIDLKKPDRKNWKELIPQDESATLRGVDVVGGKFFANYLEDASSRIRSYKLNGKADKQVALRGLGTAYGFGGKAKDRYTFYSYMDFTQPTTIYRYDTKKGTAEVYKMPQVGFDPDDYETKQVFFPSKDGTKMAMFIVHKKGVELDGKNPTYLYGYGGFNIPLTPRFSVVDLAWLNMGGVYAQATLRGGGEYGEEWHAAGTKLEKQNVFDDFISAAEFLIEKKYTSSEKLAIGGRSNGGLLVGATMTQRPDLFGAVLAGVGVMDMLRFHKFTIGWAWVSDYGSSDDEEQFEALRAYSPYHNLKEGTEYPATLVYTADHDDRVVPSHSFKFASALQHAHRGDEPVMIRIDVKAGHGAGKPTTKRIEEWTDLWGFLVDNLDMTLPEGFGE